jgi:hypothetical protein
MARKTVVERAIEDLQRKKADYTITLQELTPGQIVLHDGLPPRWLMRTVSIETGGLAFFPAAAAEKRPV